MSWGRGAPAGMIFVCQKVLSFRPQCAQSLSAKGTKLILFLRRNPYELGK